MPSPASSKISSPSGTLWKRLGLVINKVGWAFLQLLRGSSIQRTSTTRQRFYSLAIHGKGYFFPNFCSHFHKSWLFAALAYHDGTQSESIRAWRQMRLYRIRQSTEVLQESTNSWRWLSNPEFALCTLGCTNTRDDNHAVRYQWYRQDYQRSEEQADHTWIHTS